MLNMWLNIKNNCSMKKIKNRGMSCNSLDSCICGYIQAQKVFSLGHIYFLRDKHVPVKFWYTYFTRNVHLRKRENFLTSNYTTNVGMHSLLHDIPRFLEELFLIFNQMLSIRAFGRHAKGNPKMQQYGIKYFAHGLSYLTLGLGSSN